MRAESDDIYKRIKDTLGYRTTFINSHKVVDEFNFPVMITGKLNGEKKEFEGSIVRVLVEDGFFWDSFEFDIELNQNISSNTIENLEDMEICEKDNRNQWVYGRVKKIFNEEMWNERKKSQKEEEDDEDEENEEDEEYETE